MDDDESPIPVRVGASLASAANGEKAQSDGEESKADLTHSARMRGSRCQGDVRRENTCRECLFDAFAIAGQPRQCACPREDTALCAVPKAGIARLGVGRSRFSRSTAAARERTSLARGQLS